MQRGHAPASRITNAKSFQLHLEECTKFLRPHAKQVELCRLEFNDATQIHDAATIFFKHSDLRNSLPQTRSNILAGGGSTSGDTNSRSLKSDAVQTKVCCQWNYPGSCSCDTVEASHSGHHKCRVCAKDHPMLHCPKRQTPIPKDHFNSSEPSWLASSNAPTDYLPPSLTRAISMDWSLTDANSSNLNFSVNDFATTTMVQHLLAYKWESPNTVGARLPVITQLNIPAWEFFLEQYHNAKVIEVLHFSWPVSYTSEILPTSSSSNHPYAVAFPNHVEHYIHTELSYHAIAELLVLILYFSL